MAQWIDDDYIAFVEQILSTLTSDQVFAVFKDSIENGETKTNIYQSISEKKVDDDWISIIEDTLVPLDNIIRNPRRYIKLEEDIVPVSKARNITTDSIKHLATHTNFIHMGKNGEIEPDKILNITKEESLETYENRFIMTLLVRLKGFVDKRFEIIKKSLENNSKARLVVSTKTKIDGRQFSYNLDMSQGMTAEDMLSYNSDVQKLTGVQRVARASSIINDFFMTPFYQALRNSAPVTPPITRTNVILKNPDFKQCLMLWQFIETYEKVGYMVSNSDKNYEGDPEIVDRINRNMFLHYILLKEIDEDKSIGELAQIATGGLGGGGATGNASIAGTPKDILGHDELKNKVYRALIDDAVNRGNISEKDLKTVLRRIQYQREIISREEFKAIQDAIDRCVAKEKEYQQFLVDEKIRKQKELQAKKEAERKKKEKQKALKLARKKAKQLKLLLKKKEEKEKQRQKELLKKEKERKLLEAKAEKERLKLEKQKAREELRKQKELEKAKRKEELAEKRRLAREEKARKEKERKERERLLAEKRKKAEEEELRRLIEAGRKTKENNPLDKQQVNQPQSTKNSNRIVDLEKEKEKLNTIEQKIVEDKVNEEKN